MNRLLALWSVLQDRRGHSFPCVFIVILFGVVAFKFILSQKHSSLTVKYRVKQSKCFLKVSCLSTSHFGGSEKLNDQFPQHCYCLKDLTLSITPLVEITKYTAFKCTPAFRVCLESDSMKVLLFMYEETEVQRGYVCCSLVHNDSAVTQPPGSVSKVSSDLRCETAQSRRARSIVRCACSTPAALPRV